MPKQKTRITTRYTPENKRLEPKNPVVWVDVSPFARGYFQGRKSEKRQHLYKIRAKVTVAKATPVTSHDAEKKENASRWGTQLDTKFSDLSLLPMFERGARRNEGNQPKTPS